ncbi:hypothetical protein DFH09DRAFT_1321555 [Mycena vulgaris]|nr:hypothetical protein DFH09DRAFT_1321555 [Mycena vulgaris]
MAAVFGNDRSSIKAKAWMTCWSVLSTAGEAMDRNEAYTVSPIPLLDGVLNGVLNLEIETYIDLSSSKLAQHFAPDQGSPEPVVVDAAKKPVKNTKTKWVEEDTEWDAEAW